MKILKKVSFIIAIIVTIPLIAALFVKHEFTSVRNITINKPKQEVFNYIKHLSNQKEYDVWHKMDPEAWFEPVASCYMLTNTQGETQTIVKWRISDTSPHPFNLMSLFFDMGDDFDQGLQHLKTILESR